jgi:hypothetical protein
MSSAFAALAGSTNMTAHVFAQALAATPSGPPRVGSGALTDDEREQALRMAGACAELDGAATGMNHDLCASGSSEMPPQCQRVIADFCAQVKPDDLTPTNLWKGLMCALGVFAHCQSALLHFTADLAICASSDGPGVGDIPLDFGARSCPYPAQRIADGGYADNTAAAQSVGALQRKAGEGARLRVVLVLNEQCDTPGSGCSPHTDVAMLFGGAASSNLVPAPSQQVFAAPWASVRSQLKAIAGTKYVNSASISTTTVPNAAFDVAGGSPVDVLLLTLDGPISLIIGTSSNLADYRELGDFAADATKPAVVELVRSWMLETAFEAERL